MVVEAVAGPGPLKGTAFRLQEAGPKFLHFVWRPLVALMTRDGLQTLFGLCLIIWRTHSKAEISRGDPGTHIFKRIVSEIRVIENGFR